MNRPWRSLAWNISMKEIWLEASHLRWVWFEFALDVQTSLYYHYVKYNIFAKATQERILGVDCKGLVFTEYYSTESLDAAESHEQLQSVHTERRTDKAAQTHVPPSTFTDTAPLESNDEGTTENLVSPVDNASLMKDTIVKRNRKPRGSYRRYNLDQIENFLP